MDHQSTDTRIAENDDTEILDDNDYFGKPEPGLHLHFYGGSRDHTHVDVDAAGQYLLGRSRECDFRFSDFDRTDIVVSRKHAMVDVRRDGARLVNLNPRNGLFLNGVQLADGQEVELNDTDVVALGANGPHIRVRVGDLQALRTGETRYALNIKNGIKNGGAENDQ